MSDSDSPKDGHDVVDFAKCAKRQRAKQVKHPGPPTVLTPEIEEKIIAAIRGSGMSLRTACAVAGISETTLWRRRKNDSKFAARIEDALEQFKGSMLCIIAAAAPEKWGAAAWFLERRFPEEFGRRGIEREHSDSVKVIVEGGRRRENDDNSAS